ncbi:MAG TPA: fasciclin domain-containing protein [Flavobacterium sp.]|jgi:uncharacterized surface protein with fasciclin (FAS1) repeats
MKTFFKIKNLAAALFIAVACLSCNDDDASGPSESLLDLAQQDPSLTTFVQAVQRAEITGNLEGNQTFTILAPHNTAFNEFFIQNGYSGIDAVPVDVLKQLLYNHMISAEFKAEDFLIGYISTNATGTASTTNRVALFIDTISGIKFNGNSTLVTPNIDARNGVLHIVNRVIKVPTVYDHLLANPALSAFTNALAQSQGSGFVATLSGTTESPFTVLAPQNTAFTAFLDETNHDALSEIPAEELASLLNYHIITDENILSSGFFQNQVLTARNGQNINITLTGGGKKATDVNNRVSNIIFTDIQASNGIVHVLDKVLMPN